MSDPAATLVSSPDLAPQVTEFLVQTQPHRYFRITRPNGAEVVVMSAIDFDALDATAQTLSNPEGGAKMKKRSRHLDGEDLLGTHSVGRFRKLATRRP